MITTSVQTPLNLQYIFSLLFQILAKSTMDKTQHVARLLETNKSLPEPASRMNGLRFWKRGRRAECAVCLQVHQIRGLPSAMDGRVVAVGWKTKGCKGEQTLPVEVCEGIAGFDELFLHYCSVDDVRSVLKGFIVLVSLVDAGNCNLARFNFDLNEVGSVENLNSKFGGKTVSFDLEGIARGGVLSIGVYCSLMEEDTHDSCSNGAGQKQSKSMCFSCLPDLKCRRRRPLNGSVRRVPSLQPDPGFITMESSIGRHYPLDDEDESFITIEKGSVRARSRRFPSDDLKNTDDDEFEEPEDEKPCLLMELNNEEFDVDRVEDEFLKMLEEKYWKEKEGEPRSLKLSVDLEMESLIKEAEMELNQAVQVWKSRVGGALLEKEEYEELMKRWGSNGNSFSGCSVGFGFGSPI